MSGQAGNSVDCTAGVEPALLAALSLGWEMSDLYVAPYVIPTADHPPAELPGIAQLGPRDRIEMSIARVSTLLDRTLSSQSNGELPPVHSLREVPEGDVVAWRRAVYALHRQLLKRLEARDGTLSSAYDLGRSLAETSRDPKDLTVLMARLEPERLLPIQGRLADLSSKLPAHATAAVSATLEQWKHWTADARAREDMGAVRGALSRQRDLWKALLSGEKEARQMLDPDTVVAASVRHASRLGTLIRGLTGAYLPALAALAVSVALLLWTIIDQSGIATVIAALGALAATMLGIRKSLALTALDTIDELRAELWGAELDAAIAQSILRLPPAPPVERRARLSLAKPTTPAGQLAERAGITQRIERALHVTHSARRQGLRVPASGPATTEPQETAEQASSHGPSAS